MDYEPTPEQKRIIEESSNCVVIAKPGSGKTYTIAQKIRCILVNLPFYQGVIAISYTNKASDELENRSLSAGIDRKNSFFGTIDKFFISEIIIPFGDRVFGPSNKEISVVKLSEIDVSKYPEYNSKLSDNENSAFFGKLFREGNIPLEKVGFLALFVFSNSLACRRYIKARFTHIFVDEYQDCDEWQHRLFIELVNLGLSGLAVGDLDQSIFAFASKSSEFLASLSRGYSIFHTYSLSLNHRCHTSIVNYSMRLIASNYELQPIDEIRVFHKHVEGSEIDIAHWLSRRIPVFANRFLVENNNKIGILFTNRQTGNLIHNHIELPNKQIISTPLDEDSSLWSSVFRKILFWAYSHEETKYEFVERFLNVDYQKPIVLRVMEILQNLESAIAIGDPLLNYIYQFEQIAKLIFPNAVNSASLTNLHTVLSDSNLISSFMPPADDEIQLLTLHKAKGLEFDLVFHLNLYKYILPKYKGDYSQDLNLHYVGITRAKKCCVLCSSSQRHRSEEVINAEASEFLFMNDLEHLRISLND